MGDNNPLIIILTCIGVAVYMVVGNVFKPDFFWNGGIVTRFKKMFGVLGAQIAGFMISVIMIAIAVILFIQYQQYG